MKYASNNIRNILIAGHAGSGKTTLTEALVYFSGAAERMGTGTIRTRAAGAGSPTG